LRAIAWRVASVGSCHVHAHVLRVAVLVGTSKGIVGVLQYSVCGLKETISFLVNCWGNFLFFNIIIFLMGVKQSPLVTEAAF
jgi:hypothetical protein